MCVCVIVVWRVAGVVQSTFKFEFLYVFNESVHRVMWVNCWWTCCHWAAVGRRKFCCCGLMRRLTLKWWCVCLVRLCMRCLTDSRCGSVECVCVVWWRSLRGDGRSQGRRGCPSAAQCCGRPYITGLSGGVCARPNGGLTGNGSVVGGECI